MLHSSSSECRVQSVGYQICQAILPFCVGMPSFHIYLYFVDHCYGLSNLYLSLPSGKHSLILSPSEPVKSLAGGIAAGVFIAGLLLGVTCGIGITLNVTRCRRQRVDVSNMNICGFIVSLFIA